MVMIIYLEMIRDLFLSGKEFEYFKSKFDIMRVLS